MNKLTRHGQYCDVNQDVVSPVSICICPFLVSSLFAFIYVRHAEEFPHKDRCCWQTKLNHRTAYFVLPSTYRTPRCIDNSPVLTSSRPHTQTALQLTDHQTDKKRNQLLVPTIMCNGFGGVGLRILLHRPELCW